MTGVMPMHMPVLTSIWKKRLDATPTHTSMLIVLFERSPTIMQRMMTTESRSMMSTHATMPSSSPATAKMKSVCLPVSAPDCVCAPWPRPRPVACPPMRAYLLRVVCHVMPQPSGSMLGSYGARMRRRWYSSRKLFQRNGIASAIAAPPMRNQ